jgi:uncharacterized protein
LDALSPPIILTSSTSLSDLLLLLSVGVLFGVINTLAGGGSIFSLPALLFLGVSPHAANATNRLGGILQTLSATWSFFRRGEVDRGPLLLLSFYAITGGVLGSSVSLLLSQESMDLCIQACLFAVALFTLMAPKRLFIDPPPAPKAKWIQHIMGLLVAFYGGFLQAGIGLVSLYYFRFFWGRGMVEATILKTVFIVLFTAPALIIFIEQDQVRWAIGGTLALGAMIGAQLGVNLSLSPKGAELIGRALPIAGVLMILGLMGRAL